MVGALEDDQEFQSFTDSISKHYAAQTPVQRELVHRLCAILWRLRRAHAIETGLLSLQAKIQRDVHLVDPQPDMVELFGLALPNNDRDLDLADERHRTEAKARAFLRLVNFNGPALDQLNRYEVALWRQAIQLMVFLDGDSGGLLR